MAEEITDEEFNFYLINKSEKLVALPALKEVFKTLWEKKFPKEPWTNDKENLEKFEENVVKACIKRAVSHSNPQHEKQKIKFILASLQKDESWYKFDWDINILSKVLVDCRLFDLERLSVKLCDHITGIKDIRNKTAHSTVFGLETHQFKDTMKAYKKHVKGLKVVIKVDQYLQTLENIESQENPVNQQKEMLYEIQIMKLSVKLYQEKEMKLLERENLRKIISQLSLENKDLTAHFVKKTHENKIKVDQLTTELKMETYMKNQYRSSNENLKFRLNNNKEMNTLLTNQNSTLRNNIKMLQNIKEDNIHLKNENSRLQKSVMRYKLISCTSILFLFILLIILIPLLLKTDQHGSNVWSNDNMKLVEKKIVIFQKNLTNEVVYTLLREKELFENKFQDVNISCKCQKELTCCLEELSEFYRSSAIEKAHCMKHLSSCTEKCLFNRSSQEHVTNNLKTNCPCQPSMEINFMQTHCMCHKQHTDPLETTQEEKVTTGTVKTTALSIVKG